MKIFSNLKNLLCRSINIKLQFPSWWGSCIFYLCWCSDRSGSLMNDFQSGQCCTLQHCTALHCTALHYTAMYCTALPCTDVLNRTFLRPFTIGLMYKNYSTISTIPKQKQKYWVNPSKKEGMQGPNGTGEHDFTERQDLQNGLVKG